MSKTVDFRVYLGPSIKFAVSHKEDIEDFLLVNERCDLFIPDVSDQQSFYVIPERKALFGRELTVSSSSNQAILEALVDCQRTDEIQEMKWLFPEFFEYATLFPCEVSWFIIPYYG